MEQFITKYGDMISGVTSGFDRLVFRGSLGVLAYTKGMYLYLSRVPVLLNDFVSHAKALTEQIKQTTKALAKARGIKVIYLPSAKMDKEAIARQIAAEQCVTEGLICILSTVEPCRTYRVRRDRKAKEVHLEPVWRKCLFYYHYMIHPVFGFMSARIQTWIPFPIQICINGREWLSRQLDAIGLGYIRRENSFVWLEDVPRTQQLFDKQLKASWPKLLSDIARKLNPAHHDMFRQFPVDYYWCVYQSEWATDVLFRNADELARLHPRFVHHGLSSFASPDLLRFLGRKTTKQGKVHGRFQGQIVSTLKHRPECVRIRHSVNNNSIKLYNKQGSVLRAETTINDNRDLKVFRRKEGQSDGPQSWRMLRKGIADLHRRAHLSQAANERYLDALAAVSDDATLEELTSTICRPVRKHKKHFRALRPWEPNDFALLQAVARGEFFITGFRNRDIAQILFQIPASSKEQKRISAAVSYRLRILRAHGLVAKIQRTHRYRMTKKGCRIITAIMAAHQATVSQLTKEAA
jgi:hypothetical protein